MKAAGRISAASLLMNSLLIFVPIAAWLELSRADPTWVFATAAAAIIPLAGWMGKATEHLAEALGEGAGGLLNATFGNAAELIIAIIALRAGLHDVVKASITGSVLGNLLLVLGLSMLSGGVRHHTQYFGKGAATSGASLLILSAIALVIPTIFHHLVGSGHRLREQSLSLEISVVLFATYLLSLLFTLKTHRHLYVGEASPEHDEALGVHGWPRWKAVAVLMLSTAMIAVMAEFLVGAVAHTAAALGMTEVFVGVILVAIIGNAAEHSTAVLMALKDKMGLALGIAVGSSLQIVLFVAPVLIFISYSIGTPMNLVFTPLEVLSIMLAVLAVNVIILDGESNWMEGVQLLAVYLILGIAFYFLP